MSPWSGAEWTFEPRSECLLPGHHPPARPRAEGHCRLPPGSARGCEGGSLQQPQMAQPAGIECLLYVRPGAGRWWWCDGHPVLLLEPCNQDAPGELMGLGWEAQLGPGLEPAHPLREAHLCPVWSLPTPTPILGAQPEAAEQSFSRGPGCQETRDTWGLQCQSQEDFPEGSAPPGSLPVQDG